MTERPLPTVIQGGMGIAVSSWQLAREVSLAGELGVVSGTGLDAVLTRTLQNGDPGGHYRRALAHFPNQAVAERIIAKWTHVLAAKEPGTPLAGEIQATLWALAAHPLEFIESLKPPLPPPNVKTSPSVLPRLAARANIPKAKLSVGRVLKSPDEYQPSLPPPAVLR